MTLDNWTTALRNALVAGTPEEKYQALLDSGVLTSKGKLAKPKRVKPLVNRLQLKRAVQLRATCKGLVEATKALKVASRRCNRYQVETLLSELLQVEQNLRKASKALKKLRRKISKDDVQDHGE
jgi:hypothetical protein